MSIRIPQSVQEKYANASADEKGRADFNAELLSESGFVLCMEVVAQSTNEYAAQWWCHPEGVSVYFAENSPTEYRQKHPALPEEFALSMIHRFGGENSVFIRDDIQQDIRLVFNREQLPWYVDMGVLSYANTGKNGKRQCLENCMDLLIIFEQKLKTVPYQEMNDELFVSMVSADIPRVFFESAIPRNTEVLADMGDFSCLLKRIQEYQAGNEEKNLHRSVRSFCYLAKQMHLDAIQRGDPLLLEEQREYIRDVIIEMSQCKHLPELEYRLSESPLGMEYAEMLAYHLCHKDTLIKNPNIFKSFCEDMSGEAIDLIMRRPHFKIRGLNSAEAEGFPPFLGLVRTAAEHGDYSFHFSNRKSPVYNHIPLQGLTHLLKRKDVEIKEWTWKNDDYNPEGLLFKLSEHYLRKINKSYPGKPDEDGSICAQPELIELIELLHSHQLFSYEQSIRCCAVGEKAQPFFQQRIEELGMGRSEVQKEELMDIWNNFSEKSWKDLSLFVHQLIVKNPAMSMPLFSFLDQKILELNLDKKIIKPQSEFKSIRMNRF